MQTQTLSPLSRITRPFLVGLLVLLTAGIAWAGDSGRCHSATVPSEMVLPNGSVHSPGSLKVCAVRTHSPSATQLEVSVDGHPVQLVIGRSGAGENPTAAGRPFFVFHRNDANQLVLQGLAVPSRGKLRTYAMVAPRYKDYEVTSTWELLAANYEAGEPGSQPLILIAAAR